MPTWLGKKSIPDVLDVPEVLRTIGNAQQVDSRCQIEPGKVKAWLDAEEDFTFVDVRPPEEREGASLPSAEPLDFADSGRYMSLPKDRRIVFHCQDGVRALDVASYFIGHQFTNVFAVRGGLLAWSDEVDASVTKYD